MYIALTDLLTCPRCGSGQGLILRADRMEERRVFDGVLGCPNCHTQYPVAGGFADLRLQPASRLPGADVAPARGGSDEAFRLAALMGVTRGLGFSLVVGPGARLAPGIAEAVENLEVIAVDERLAGWPEEAGTNRLAASAARLPLVDRSMRAVALTGPAGAAWLEEGVRVLGARGRLVLEGGAVVEDARLAALGLEVVAREGDTVVAVRS